MGLLKDLFFGGAERGAARMQADAGREAVNVVEPAVRDSINALQPYGNIGQQAINPLLRAGTNMTPVSGQNALRDRVFGGRAPSSADFMLNRAVTGAGPGAGDRALENLVLNGPGNEVERENIVRDVTNRAAAMGKNWSGGRELELGRQLTAEQNRYRGQRASELLSLIDSQRQGNQQRINNLFGLTGQQRDDRLAGINELLALTGVQQGDRNANFSRLLDLVGIGGNATNAQNSLRVGGAGAVSDLITGIGNANAAGRVAGANATRGTLNSILDTVLAVKGF